MSPISETEERRAEREAMVREQIASRGINNRRVLAAMLAVPRHWFVPPDRVDQAYADHPLPIGAGQTISQPYMVAYMADVVGIDVGQRVLEIGAGCGFQAAVLAAMGADVTALEIVPELVEKARPLLTRLNLDNLNYIQADGGNGWPANAPYHAIIFSCAVPNVPHVIFDQLAVNGRLVAPVAADSPDHQFIYRWHKLTNGQVDQEKLIAVRFVPMTGKIIDDRNG